MHKIKNKTAPSSFLEKFEQPSHSNSTRFSNGNTENRKLNYANVDFEFPLEVIWNDLIGSTEKEIQPSSYFKTKIKSKLLNFENEVTFF